MLQGSQIEGLLLSKRFLSGLVLEDRIAESSSTKMSQTNCCADLGKLAESGWPGLWVVAEDVPVSFR